MKWILILGLGCFTRVYGAPLFSENFEKGLTKQWEPVKFEGFTDYKVVKEKEGHALQAKAVSSASGLGIRAEFPVRAGTKISWQWKIDKTPPGGSDDVKKTFDHTARIFVAFKTTLGPPRTINYVWANKIQAGKTFHHPSSGRARFIVLQSGNAKAGEWLTESRDLYADWKTLFGDDDPPKAVSIGLMTDSDGTGTTVTGWYDDFLVASP